MITGNPGHLKTFDYLGLYRYFLTFCTYNRQALFASQEVVELLLEQILRTARAEGFAVLAYCFMPDHLHLLVEGRTASSDARRFIKRAKQCSGYAYARAFSGRAWQRYGFDHVLRNDEITLRVIRYILENPVRARLVRCVEDYPYSGTPDAPLDPLEADPERPWCG
jgi:putative transposase